MPTGRADALRPRRVDLQSRGPGEPGGLAPPPEDAHVPRERAAGACRHGQREPGCRGPLAGVLRSKIGLCELKFSLGETGLCAFWPASSASCLTVLLQVPSTRLTRLVRTTPNSQMERWGPRGGPGGLPRPICTSDPGLGPLPGPREPGKGVLLPRWSWGSYAPRGRGLSGSTLENPEGRCRVCPRTGPDFSWLLCWAPGCCWWHCLQ